MKILIDNGHGIETPGKRSPDGLFREYRYNRLIASSLVSKLRERGFDADLVVPEDDDISLKTRAIRVNKWCELYGKDNVLLISVHCNLAPPDDGNWHKWRGWSAYTTPGETQSDALAACLYKAADEVFTKDKGPSVRRNSRDYLKEDYEENFYILRKTLCPAVLTENFFMDNQKDVDYLLSSQGKKDIVKVHLMAIEDYCNKCKQ